jgi:hypothetical protein
MSARAPDVLGLGLVLTAGVDDAERVCDAVEAFYAAVGIRPRKITWNGPKVATRAYKPQTLRGVATDPRVKRLSIWSESAARCPYLRVHLRDEAGFEEYEQRPSGVVMPGGNDLGPVIELVRALGRETRIASGSIARYASERYAEHECFGGGDRQDVDEATNARLHEDAMLWRLTHTRLRRLYPMNIIGPELWASLPAMPPFEPRPTIEDLGDCKLLTAWPELCEPRDPAFLRATRDLRLWLWPYTIQNPADHVDNDPAG